MAAARAAFFVSGLGEGGGDREWLLPAYFPILSHGQGQAVALLLCSNAPSHAFGVPLDFVCSLSDEGRQERQDAQVCPSYKLDQRR